MHENHIKLIDLYSIIIKQFVLKLKSDSIENDEDNFMSIENENENLLNIKNPKSSISINRIN